MNPPPTVEPLVSVFHAANPAATEVFGRRLGSLLFPNAIVALNGPLGAGKTYLTRAIADGLGISDPSLVSSPTFVLIHEYDARLPIFHFDAYRLRGAEEFLELGTAEYFSAGGVCLIEWAERVADALPKERLQLDLQIAGPDARQIAVAAWGEAAKRLAVSLLSTDP